MKKLILLILLCMGSQLSRGQRPIRDEHIANQQERMVFKSWDENKFTPKPGFLGLNPLYWMTWALHPNYRKTDLRPLGPFGPQTQRLGMVQAMLSSEEAYKRQSDTLKNVALGKSSVYSGLLSDLDPLWLLYYKTAFSPLLSGDETELDGLSEKEKKYLVSSGIYQWYLSEKRAISERLEITRRTNLERGSRLLTYQRLLKEYEKLQGTWSEKKRLVWKYLSISQSSKAVKDRSEGISTGSKRDIEIADEILKHSKL